MWVDTCPKRSYDSLRRSSSQVLNTCFPISPKWYYPVFTVPESKEPGYYCCLHFSYKSRSFSCHQPKWKDLCASILTGQELRSSGNPQAWKSEFSMGWRLTTGKWEFPGIYGLLFFFFFHLDKHSKTQSAHLISMKMSSETKQCHVCYKRNKQKTNIPFTLCFFYFPFALTLLLPWDCRSPQSFNMQVFPQALFSKEPELKHQPCTIWKNIYLRTNCTPNNNVYQRSN